MKKGVVDVNVQDENGVSLIFVASRFGHSRTVGTFTCFVWETLGSVLVSGISEGRS